MTDEFLLKAIKKDDNEAFKELFDKYYQQLVSYTITFTNDLSLAEDIVQQTFIILWEKRADFEINKSIKSYLYTVSHNTYIDYYRKLKRQDSFLDDLKYEALNRQTIEDNDLTEKRIKQLKAIIEELPPRCKEILLLNKTKGLKYSEIAKLLDISNKTVESQMRIAFKKIREGFEKGNILLLLFTKKVKSIIIK
ncbi:RNA polymerase sigma factor [Thalassobellus citreus]|uniref:RNA polymerase sigma factor n=1 Tax=Thalassobellus citreus TaxID=3367752 RepID=UPI003799E906